MNSLIDAFDRFILSFDIALVQEKVRYLTFIFDGQIDISYCK